MFLTHFNRFFDCGPLALQHDRFIQREVTTKPLMALTFDDGQADNYFYALPILSKHTLKATFFIPVTAVEKGELLWHDRLGFAIKSLLAKGVDSRKCLIETLRRENLLSDNQSIAKIGDVVQRAKTLSIEDRLRIIVSLTKVAAIGQQPEFARIMTVSEISELSHKGHEVGSHSMTHCLMTECSDSALDYELAESRRRLEDWIQMPVSSFCYPNGNSDARTSSAVERAGYIRAVTTDWGSNDERRGCFRLRRFDMNAEHVMDPCGRLIPSVLALRMSGFNPMAKR
jgi:peptidoglycan/xylan/chitin deacetylase (PgdA/CDA1 family)